MKINSFLFLNSTGLDYGLTLRRRLTIVDFDGWIFEQNALKTNREELEKIVKIRKDAIPKLSVCLEKIHTYFR